MVAELWRVVFIASSELPTRRFIHEVVAELLQVCLAFPHQTCIFFCNISHYLSKIQHSVMCVICIPKRVSLHEFYAQVEHETQCVQFTP